MWSLRNQPASATRTRTSATYGFAKGFSWTLAAQPDASFGGRDQLRGHGNSLPNLIRADASVFVFFAGRSVGGDVHPGDASRHLSGPRSLPRGERGWDFQVEDGMARGGGHQFYHLPKPRGTIHGRRGHFFRDTRAMFSRSGDECFEDFHPIPTGRGRENIFRGLARTSDQRTRDRFSTQPRNEGTIFPATRRDFQTTS